MNDNLLPRWADALATDLGIERTLEVDTILKLAADAAHGVVRPAAPITTFLAGVAIGQSGADPARIAEILQTIHEAIARWEAPSPD